MYRTENSVTFSTWISWFVLKSTVKLKRIKERTLNVNQSTISRLWNRFQQTGSTNDDQRSVRPRIATHGKDRYIWVFHLRNRTIAVSITATGILGMRRTSSQTVRNRLRQHGIRPIRPFFGEVLMPLHLREIVR
jgi:hypothetical protein